MQIRTWGRHRLAARRSIIAATALLLASTSLAQAATLVLQGVVMTGLSNPRGLVVGPDGAVYVAVAGRGGTGPSIVDGAGETVSLGFSSGISRSRGGVQETVIAGLPSLAPAGGFGATGVHDVAFSADGTLHAVLGFGGDPTLRSTLPEEAGLLGQIIAVTGGTATTVADLAGYELTDSPDGPELNSNPFSLEPSCRPAPTLCRLGRRSTRPCPRASPWASTAISWWASSPASPSRPVVPASSA